MAQATHAGVPAASQVGFLVASTLLIHVGRGWRHHHEVVRHTSVQRERADGERLQRLVGLGYGDVVEPHIEWRVGFRVILLNETTLQRRHGVDDPLEVYALRVRAVTGQPLRGNKASEGGGSVVDGGVGWRDEVESEGEGEGEAEVGLNAT